MNADHDNDVLVVGAGPVGMVLALLLARRGWSVRIVERYAEPYPLPRAVGMSHDSLRCLQATDLIPVLEQHMDLEGAEHDVAQYFAADGEVLMTQSMPGADISGYLPMVGFNQPDIEAELDRACEDHALIQLERGWEVVAVEQTEDAASVRMIPAAGSEGGAERTATGRSRVA